MFCFSSTDIEQVIKNSLKKSILSTGNNKLKSSIFVSSVAELLFNSYRDSRENHSLRVIGYDEESGKRKSGESLLDITIAKTKIITDPGNKQSSASISYQLIWAAESEANTSLPAFTADFGKLLCTKSTHYLYLNGLDQIKEESREAYMIRRLTIARQLLHEAGLEYNRFFYAFWPSPNKNHSKNKSFWDMHHKDDLLNMVRVFEL